jgi:hypothetical protein
VKKTLALVLFSLASSYLPAQDWAASTGTPDTASYAKTLIFGGDKVFLQTNVQAGTITLRYNVLPVGDIVNPVSGIECRAFFVQYVDNGPGARVVLRLKKKNMHNTLPITLLTFDSDSLPSQGGWQSQQSPCLSFNFHFTDQAAGFSNDNFYYIEAQITRNDSSGTPGLSGFSLQRLVP